MLDGAPCPGARARRAPHEGWARLDLGTRLLGIDPADARSAARHVDARPWGGGARRADRRSGGSRFGAPRTHQTTELADRWPWGGSAPPNGSRLSCGRNARWRKEVERSPCPARGTTLRFL